MKPTNYSDLHVWKEAKKLGVLIYYHTSEFPKQEQFGLTQQIRRAAVSIFSNVPESCGREHLRDTLQFLYIARGSMYEVEAQMHLAHELGYFSDEHLKLISEQLLRFKKILFGFISYYRKKL